MSGKPVVMVLGASGNIGAAALRALTSQYADKFDIRAGVRNPDKADSIKDIKGITVVKATMGDESLSSTLKGVDRLFIVTPGILNRVEVTKATAVATKEAGIKHVLVVSGTATASADSTESTQSMASSRMFQGWLDIESFFKELGIEATFIRLPFFMENYYGSVATVKSQSSIHMPLDPTKPFTCVVVGDAGTAAAAILAEPTKHAGKTYNIVSNRHTMNELCEELSIQLDKTVSYVRQSYDEAKKNFLAVGVPEWQIDVLLDAYRLIDSGSPISNQSDISHFHNVTGKAPTSLHDWIAGAKSAFQ